MEGGFVMKQATNNLILLLRTVIMCDVLASARNVRGLPFWKFITQKQEPFHGRVC
jgi:hypothetical protein